LPVWEWKTISRCFIEVDQMALLTEYTDSLWRNDQ